ncbi:MAG TPA: ABC transporter substrate-binding protein [Thermoplasmata archaeon]|nr:ABC transporter substrate-binding protein [Thermoplasmata archaeon]
MRVVSVLPSATEIVCALGHRDELVGRSAECDYPESVRSLPVVMRPKIWDADRSSAEIDARVRSVRSTGASLYELDIELLRRLEPDVILTQDLCGVCSVTDAEVATACARADVAPLVVSLTPRTLAGVWETVDRVGRVLSDPEAGRALARELAARSRPPRSRGSRPRVAVVEWLDPPILAGLWAPEIVHAAGGEPVGAQKGRPGSRTDWNAIRAAQPDLVVLSPCSFSVPRTQRELRDPVLRDAVEHVSAGRGVWIADEAYFSRPGPRLADGVDLIRHLLAGDRWDPPMPVVAGPCGEVPA